MKPKERLTLRDVVLGALGLGLILFLAGFFITSTRPGEPSLSGDLLRKVGVDPRLIILLLVVGIIVAALLGKTLGRRREP